ncbi:MAG: 5' nucleotidase, NT5C type [Dissulfuribacterales bacterium]
MIHPAELAFDIDGVIADTMSLFIDIARMDFGISGIRYEEITEYDINGFPGLDKIMVMRIIKRILDGRHSASLEPLSGAPAVLKRLNQKHCPTLFVTARPNADQIYDWLLEALSLEPTDIEIVATGSFEDKQDVLLGRGITSFVEDRLETCFLLSEAGVNPIVFKQPWNRKPHPFREVENWQELESLIEFE